jgi:hypothetical protein
VTDNVHYLPSYEPPEDEPLPSRAELADLLHHGLMSASDASEYPVSDPLRAKTMAKAQNGSGWGVGLIWGFVVVTLLIGPTA